MSVDGIKSADLAKELGVKATDVVTAVARLRVAEYKKGTTNIKLSDDEAVKIRNLFAPKAPAKTVAIVEEAPPQPVKNEIKPEKRKEAVPHTESVAEKEIHPAKVK